MYCIVLYLFCSFAAMENYIANVEAQMRKGILELCILNIIAAEESYPSDIILKLKESKMIVVEGTLYPLLTRLKTLVYFLTNGWKAQEDRPESIISLLTRAKNALQN